MQKTLAIILATTLFLGGCAGIRESRINPLNWFGKSEARATNPSAEGFVRQADPRPLADQVTAMSIESVSQGAILRATGLPSTQGHWDAELVQYKGEGVDAGVLVFDFRLAPPRYRANAGAPYTREVEVATYLTFNDLAGISRIVVRGQRSERSVRR